MIRPSRLAAVLTILAGVFLAVSWPSVASASPTVNVTFAGIGRLGPAAIGCNDGAFQYGTVALGTPLLSTLSYSQNACAEFTFKLSDPLTASTVTGSATGVEDGTETFVLFGTVSGATGADSGLVGQPFTLTLHYNLPPIPVLGWDPVYGSLVVS